MTPPLSSRLVAVSSASSSPPHPSSPSSSSKRFGKRPREDFIQPHVDDDGRGGSKRERVLSSATRVCILDDKLSAAERDAARGMVVQLGGMNASMSFANVILTGMRAPRRVERYLDDDVRQRNVPVLHLDWLYDSAKARLLQGYESYLITGGGGHAETKTSVASSPATTTAALPADETRSDDYDAATISSREATQEGSQTEEEDSDVPDEAQQEDHDEDATNDPAAPPWRNVEYACMRPSPLKSRHNQALINELEVLRLQRILAGKQEMNATAYGRAISAIKAYPHSLAPNPGNAKNLKGVGPKIAKLIVQYYEEGRIAEVESIRNDSSFNVMTQFTQLYGVGPKRAREYYSAGARTLDGVIKMGGSLSVHLHVDECLRILPDLQCTIPRVEVAEIARFVYDEVLALMPGCTYVVCGGYRRGKPASNDVDVVICLPKPDDEKSGGSSASTKRVARGLWNSEEQLRLMEDLLRTLKRKAFITHVVNVTTPSSTYEATYSRLDIAEVVVMSKRSENVTVPRYRRVDIILGPWDTHGAAVLGWTGSRQFERDIRLVAKRKGYTFHSTGLVPQGEKRPLSTPKEEDIFEVLDLPFMPPHLRNADA